MSGTPYEQPDPEELQETLEMIRAEVLEMAQKLFDGETEDGEEITCALICARCAIIACIGQILEHGYAATPPSIWLGEQAGTMLTSEMLNVTEHVQRHSEMN